MPNGAPPVQELSPDAAVYFRDSLRQARAAALRDSEGFAEIFFSLERLGRYLNPEGIGLGEYRDKIARIVENSALSRAIEHSGGRLHTPFQALYKLVQQARNSALHEGAFARHLTSRSIELALMVEDALIEQMDRIGDFMVRGPVCASPWQPLSFVRQTMLANSFSYLPVWIATDGGEGWRLVSDFALASYLRRSAGRKEREARLSQPLGSAVGSPDFNLREPFICTPDCPIADALGNSRGLPILIHGDRVQDLLGIASPYDLL